MLPSAGPQYKDIPNNSAIAGMATKGTAQLVKGLSKARKIKNQYVTGKLGEIRKNVLELKDIEAEREARGITSFGDPEIGAVFPLKSEAAMQKPKGPRRASSAPTSGMFATGSSTSKAQMSRRATSAPAPQPQPAAKPRKTKKGK